VDFVEEAGYEAVAAENADGAIQILESRLDIRIVFTDVDMPGSMNGIKLAQAIRGRWPPVHLIITSATRAKAYDLPERGVFISKPYRLVDLADALHRFAA
jgi:CheY-like chemotaxis protein